MAGFGTRPLAFLTSRLSDGEDSRGNVHSIKHTLLDFDVLTFLSVDPILVMQVFWLSVLFFVPGSQQCSSASQLQRRGPTELSFAFHAALESDRLVIVEIPNMTPQDDLSL